MENQRNSIITWLYKYNTSYILYINEKKIWMEAHMKHKFLFYSYSPFTIYEKTVLSEIFLKKRKW